MAKPTTTKKPRSKTKVGADVRREAGKQDREGATGEGHQGRGGVKAERLP
jgi:hypothetical protein